MDSWPSIATLVKKVHWGELTAHTLVEQALKRIEEKKEYNAIIATIKDRSKQRAKAIDELVKKGEEAGRLAGIPFIAKDNFLTFGSETTAASNILRAFKA